MRLTLSSLVLTLLFSATAAHAQLYKWVGPDGRISYSDTPPPARVAARVEQKNASEIAGNSSNLPYELSQAVKNHPVTLYTTTKCDSCDEGRTVLKNRGIPFTEKTVTTKEDLTRLNQLTNESHLPVLMVGRNKHAGFQSDAWNGMLTAAGYPASNQLPKTYRYAAPEAAAPKSTTEQTAHNTRTPSGNVDNAAPANSPPPAAGNAPPGFRF